MKFIKSVLLVCMLFITVYRCYIFTWNSKPERWDEQTNLEVIQQSSFFSLEHNNEPFFEKPPVWYIISMHLNSLMLIRLFSALCGFIMILLIFFFTNKWWGFLAGFVSWIVLITTNQLYIKNPSNIFSTHTMHSADSDMLFILLVCVSFIFGVSSKKNLIIAGISSGLALLTRNPLGILPLFWITVFHHNKNHTYVAWFIAGIMYTSWIIYSYMQFGSIFFHQYFGYHILTRSIQGIEGHTQSPFYFFQILFNKQVFVFFEVYILMFLFCMKQRINDPKLRAACMISVSFLLIQTLMQTKLSWYILPFYPFAAMTIAGGFPLFIADITRIFSGNRIKSAPGKNRFKKAKS